MKKVLFLTSILGLLAGCSHIPQETVPPVQEPAVLERNTTFDHVATVGVQQIQTGMSLSELAQQGTDVSGSIAVPLRFKEEMQQLAQRIGTENPRLQTTTVWLSDWAQVKNPAAFGANPQHTLGFFVYAGDFSKTGMDWAVKAVVDITDWKILKYKTNLSPKAGGYVPAVSKLEW